jgi:hypothetical protein
MGEIESKVQTIPGNLGLPVASVLKANRSWTDIEISCQDMPDRSMGDYKSIPICRKAKAGSAARFVSSKDLTTMVFHPLGLQQIDSPQIEFAGFQ